VEAKHRNIPRAKHHQLQPFHAGGTDEASLALWKHPSANRAAASTMSLRPQRRSTDSTRITSSNGEMDKSIDPFYQHSVLESQSKAGNANVTTNELPKSNMNGDQSGSVKASDIGDAKESRHLRWSTWWLLGAVAIIVPWAVLAASAPTRTMGGVRTTGFLVWIEILWTTYWILSSCLYYIGKALFWICQWDESLKLWDTFIQNTRWTGVWFAMSLVAYFSSSVMCRISGSTCNEHWLTVLRKVLLASIPATAIFHAEDLLMEVMITMRVKRMSQERQFDKMIRRRNAMFLILFIYMEDKEKETTSQKTPVNPQPPRGQGSRDQSFASRLLSVTGKLFGTLFLRGPPEEKQWDQAKRYVLGKGRDQDFDRDGKPYPEVLVAQCVEGESMTFTETSLQERLDVKAGKEEPTIPTTAAHWNNAMGMSGKKFTATEIMKMMDKDESGEVTTDEVADFLKELVMAMRDISKSVNGIKRAARSANAVVCFLLLFVVAIIYGTSPISANSCTHTQLMMLTHTAAFFVNNLTSYLTPIWTTVTGLSFALSGTVTEFIAACQFVFSKQPYDVGDRVIIEEKELIVERVCLLYTVFQRCSDRAVEQIAHKKICDSWITNLTRSKGLFITEVASITDKTVNFTSAQLEAHEKGLVAFINEETVRRRYLDAGGVKVSLQTEQQQLVAKIKLNELMVRHEKVLSRMRGQVRDWLERLVREGGSSVEPSPPSAPTATT
jgi:hypothetical protein